MKVSLRSFVAAVAILSAAVSCTDKAVRPVPIKNIHIGGDLAYRIDRNFDRLEDDLFRPDSLFHSLLAESWPGDCPGRLVLGTVCDAQASGREPAYLQTILDRFPLFMNEQGYFGPVYEGKFDEQQLSGNGWVLRGLCQYYEWTGDAKALDMVTKIVDNLFMKGKGIFKDYPVDPEERSKYLEVGGATIAFENDRWAITSDIGSVYIGMEGLIHAYQLLGRDDLKELIDELVGRFYETDLVAMKAQAHASLTAMRALLRLSQITGDDSYVREVQKRWDLYCRFCMSPAYQDYCWFCRPEFHDEPCALVDSYMVAVQLWMLTGDAAYLDEAELIYYNALCHSQIKNGGFGCFTNPSLLTGRTDLSLSIYEAYWCCTMRGGEGLASAANYCWFTDGKELIVPFYSEGSVTLDDGFTVSEETAYPFEGSVKFTVEKAGGIKALKLRIPVGAENPSVTVDGKQVIAAVDGRFLTVKGLKEGDVVVLSFDMPERKVEEGDSYKVLRGPLLMGREAGQEELTPVYHLLDPKVTDRGYSKTVLFKK